MSTDPLFFEKELLMRISGGDQQAFRSLFKVYWNQVFSTAFVFTKQHDVSEDMSQDIFAHIWVKRAKLAEVDNFPAYLYTVSRNLIFDRLRQKVYTEANIDYFRLYFESYHPSPGQQLEFKELEQSILQAVHQLPPQQQRAFYLSRFRGLSHEQISVEMGVSKASVKSYIVRAIVTLRNSLVNYPGLVLVFLIR